VFEVRILFYVIVVAVGDLAPIRIQYCQDGIQWRPIARSCDIKRERLAGVGLEAEQIGILGVGGPIDNEGIVNLLR
jgi:hypothetical protein